jgi:hypothetical protein
MLSFSRSCDVTEHFCSRRVESDTGIIIIIIIRVESDTGSSYVRGSYGDRCSSEMYIERHCTTRGGHLVSHIVLDPVA